MTSRTGATEALGIEHPIVQGPFGGGLSSVALVAAVSNAGGLGSFGAHHLTAAEIETLSREIKQHTAKPFAINLWVGDHDGNGLELPQAAFDEAFAVLKPYFDELGLAQPARPQRFGQSFGEQIEGVLRARPPVYSFVFGIPAPEVLRECRARGIVTLGTAITVDEAAALDEAGADVIVASGFEAGGHRVAFLRVAEDSLVGTLALIPQVVDRVKAPVVAAGGIAEARGVRAALALGAGSVQIGTAFLACDESIAHPLHKAMLWSADARYTALTRAFSGRLARGIENRMLRELKDRQSDSAPYPAQNWLAAQLRRAALEQGKTDLMALWPASLRRFCATRRQLIS